MNKHLIAIASLGIVVGINPGAASAQHLPTPSRTIFKCNVNGVTVYSDSPCPGAQKLNIDPTRGADSVSGRKLVGNDVRQEQPREQIAEAVRPLTGMDANQLETAGRRQKLSLAARRECGDLDNSIPIAEGEEAKATKETRSGIQTRLFDLRQRFRGLRC
jgi:hypothetical protein